MFDSILAGFLSGIILISPMSDSQEPMTEFIRIGKNAKYDIAVDVKSIVVEWGNGVDARIINFNMQFTPLVKETIEVNRSMLPISNYMLSTSTDCGSLHANVEKVRIFVGKELVDIGSWGGPLSKWNGFGERATSELVDAVCSSTGQKKRRAYPVMT